MKMVKGLLVKKTRPGRFKVKLDDREFQELVREIFKELFGWDKETGCPNYRIQSTGLRNLQDAGELFLSNMWSMRVSMAPDPPIEVESEDVSNWLDRYTFGIMIRSMKNHDY